MRGRIRQESSDISVAVLGDSQVGVALSRLLGLWHESEVRAYKSRVSKASRVSDRYDEAQSYQRANSSYLAKHFCFWELVLAEVLDPLVVVLDLLCQLLEGLKQRQQSFVQDLRNQGASLLGERGAGARRNACAVDLALVAHEGDEPRTGLNELLASSDAGSDCEALLVPQPDWIQQVRVNSSEPGKQAGVIAVGLARVLRDQMELPGVGYEDFVPHAQEVTSHPVSWSTGFKNESTSRMLSERGVESLRGRQDLPIFEQAAITGHQAVRRFLVAEVKADGQGGGFCCTLFHGRSLQKGVRTPNAYLAARLR